MIFKVFCADGHQHNSYLFEKVIPPRCRKARWQQTVQGPLAPECLELKENEVTPIWTFVFRNGEITHKKKSYIVPIEKVYLSPEDPRTPSRDWDYLIMKPRKKNPSHLDYVTHTYEGYVEGYFPGGIVRSFSDSDKNAFKIRNEFLKERASSFAERVI